MEIVIDKSKKISSVQQEFQKLFPLLKIEFYKKMHSKAEGSSMKDMLNSETTIGNVQKKDAAGIIEINDPTTVAELENMFFEKFGLAVQVFRKSNNVWLQTTTTDNWTLAEQNQIAGENHITFEENLIDPMDRQELE